MAAINQLKNTRSIQKEFLHVRTDEVSRIITQAGVGGADKVGETSSIPHSCARHRMRA
ncbi:hypothetical protein AGR7A_Lc10174 [Agrobacterium deltaense NCPPB 1641]|uniref:Uncharacterized protein n=1 Tax=Agrobacterium deltaense NCPPB 1641 TaxID=1183425 RepID=A0A1S7TSA6_9HYPH|nr:hypothetical protein AGR7A_Lc10174 [Agrobacterium deltaense NCPPB 1641]